MRWLKIGLWLGLGFGAGLLLARLAVALSFYAAVLLLIVVAAGLLARFLGRNLVFLRTYLSLKKGWRERDRRDE